MLAETIRAFDSLDLETADSQGAAFIAWVEPQYWGLARDRNLAVVHIDVMKIAGTGCTIELVAQDSSGRIFTDLTLSGATRTSKGQYRVIIKDFGALPKGRFGRQVMRLQVRGR